jgi:hypothetical protein
MAIGARMVTATLPNRRRRAFGEGRHFQHVHPLAGGGFNACGASRPRPAAAGGLLDIRKTAGMANHLGLYLEETSLRGEACGNFPKRSPTWGLISARLTSIVRSDSWRKKELSRLAPIARFNGVRRKPRVVGRK